SQTDGYAIDDADRASGIAVHRVLADVAKFNINLVLAGQNVVPFIAKNYVHTCATGYGIVSPAAEQQVADVDGGIAQIEIPAVAAIDHVVATVSFGKVHVIIPIDLLVITAAAEHDVDVVVPLDRVPAASMGLTEDFHRRAVCVREVGHIDDVITGDDVNSRAAPKRVVASIRAPLGIDEVVADHDIDVVVAPDAVIAG